MESKTLHELPDPGKVRAEIARNLAERRLLRQLLKLSADNKRIKATAENAGDTTDDR